MPKPQSKVKRIVKEVTSISKINAFALFLLAFTLLSMPTFALETIDAQADTHCYLTNCYTIVDLSKHLNTSALNTAKSLDFNSKIPKAIEGSKVTKSSNIINISGTIKEGENRYWTMSIPELGILVDPYWNYTNGSTSAIITFDNTWTFQGSNSDFGGVVVQAQRDTTITSCERGSGVDCLYCYVFNSGGTQIGKQSFSGDTATFSSPISISNGQSYYVGVGSDGAACAAKSVNPYSFPVSNADISATGGVWWSWTGSFTTDGIMRNLYKIHTSTPSYVSVFYNFDLKLNGTSANLTAQEFTPFDVFAGGNLTNLNVSLFENGALISSALGNLTINRNLSNGLYNYTTISNNSDVLTFWAILTEEGNETTPPSNNTTIIVSNASVVFDIAALEPNYKICSADNSSRIDVYIEAGINRSITCPYGCSDNDCKPNPLYIYLGLAAFFLIIIYLARKRGKRK